MSKKVISLLLAVAMVFSFCGSALAAYGNGLTEAPSYEEYHSLAQDLTLDVAEEGIVLLKNEDNALPFDADDFDADGNLKVNLFGVASYSLSRSGGGGGGWWPGGGGGPAPFSTRAAEITYSASPNAIFDQFVSSEDADGATGKVIYNADLKDAYLDWYEEYYTYASYKSFTGGQEKDGSDLALSSSTNNDWNLENYVYDENGEVLSAPMSEEAKEQAKAFSDTAIVVLQRNSGEGTDLSNGEQRASEEEIAMLDFVTNNFENVVVIFLTANYMEAGFLEGGEYTYYCNGYGGSVRQKNMARVTYGTPGTEVYYDTPNTYTLQETDAALFIPVASSTNLGKAVKEVLLGEVNPSGHMNDTMPYSFYTNPISANVGEFEVDDYNPDFSANYADYGLMPWIIADQGDENFYDQGYWFLVYEEGIYSGYLYYETFNHYAVQYPFGYGLSYTEFDWDVGEVYTTYDEFGELNFNIDVTVTNNGDVAGKDVVQLYYSAPYYEDSVYEVEKALINLGDFQKTAEIAPNGFDTVTLTVSARDMASYSDTAENYVLEAGTYYFEVANDAGDAWEIYYGADSRANDSADYLRSWTLDAKAFAKNSSEIVEKNINLAELAYLDCSNVNYDYDQSWKDDVDKYVYNTFDGSLHIIADEVTGTKYQNLFSGDVYGDGTYNYDAEMIGELTDGYLHRVDASNGKKLTSQAEISTENYPESPTGDSVEIINYELRGIESAYDYDGISLDLLAELESISKEYDSNITYFDEDGQAENFMLSDVYQYTFNEDDANYHNIDAINAALGTDFAAYDEEVEQYIWDHFLDQLSIFELMTLFYCSGFDGPGFLQYGIVKSVNADGPESIGTKGNNKITITTFRPALLATGWNRQLAYDYGAAISGEAVSDASGKDATTFWYAPNLNAHRGPLGGRSNQNYSEDAYLSGQICSAQIQGCQSMGVVCVVKHYALNDAEYNREGVITSCSEQGIREVCLEAWETAFKDGCGSVMCSLGRVGIHQACESYAMNVSILRNEWGFDGHVITDGYGVTKYMYPISTLINGACGLLVMFNANNMSGKADYYELYEFYREYPKAINTALRQYAQDYCTNKMESGTFWYYYSDYTYDDYLATYDATNRYSYTDYGETMWYKTTIALGYEYYEEPLVYTGVTNSTNLSGLAEKEMGLKYVLDEYAIGDTVRIPVSIQDSEGMSTFGFTVLFDTDAFDYEGIDFEGTILEGYDYETNLTDRGLNIIFWTDGQIYDEQSGLLFNIDLKVKPGVKVANYGISLGVLEDVGFIGKNYQTYKTAYALGVDEDWAPEEWEGGSYPDTSKPDWGDYVGSIGGSSDANITLAASYIAIKGIAGDLNMDGEITNADVVTLARYLVDLITDADQIAAIEATADINGDGKINNVDLIKLARVIVEA